MRIILLTRMGRRSQGGIGRSGRMIAQALERLDNRVRLRNVREPLTDIPSDTDLVWHYGDYDLVDDQAAACREAAVPMLINSTYDGTAERRRWMEDLAERTGAYLAVFAIGVLDDPRLHRIAHRLVAVPKTIRLAEARPDRLSEREGVVIGELEKICRPRLARGMDVGLAVYALRRALGAKVAIYAYDQYGTSATVPPSGVTVCKPGQGLLEWIEKRRLYVSLSRCETFSMVPAEAQSVGTPVLYRSMPQGLTEHLGHTAVPFRTAEQLAMLAELVYHDERYWRELSLSGHQNAMARGFERVGPALDLALRKLVMGRAV